MAGKILSNIRRLRITYQLTQGRRVSVQEVADAIGIDKQQLDELERGTMQVVRIADLEALCVFYGIPITHMLQYQAETEQSSVASS